MAAASGGIWRSLDLPLQLAFEQAWEAFQSGSIGVGAVASAPDGRVVAVGRNRVCETDARPGQLAGTSLAHAEMNVIAQLPFRHPRELALTTTLQPCLQCTAAIRMAPVASVRYAGTDLLWDGCGDFSALGQWLRRRPPVPAEGPSSGEIGLFATMVARFGPGLIPAVEDGLRQAGEGALLDVVHDLESDGWCERARSKSVQWALDDMWPVPEAWIAPPKVRELRELVRYRAKLVALRSGLKAQIHAVLAKEGLHPRSPNYGARPVADISTASSWPTPITSRSSRCGA